MRDKNANTRVLVQKLRIKKAEEKKMCLNMVEDSKIPLIYTVKGRTSLCI